MAEDKVVAQHENSHTEVASSTPSSDAHHDAEKSREVNDAERAGRPAYPMSDEDYVVTFKTWVVVTILASAYGVSASHSDLHSLN